MSAVQSQNLLRESHQSPTNGLCSIYPEPVELLGRLLRASALGVIFKNLTWKRRKERTQGKGRLGKGDRMHCWADEASVAEIPLKSHKRLTFYIECTKGQW